MYLVPVNRVLHLDVFNKYFLKILFLCFLMFFSVCSSSHVVNDKFFCFTDKRPIYDEDDTSSLHSCHDDRSFSSRSIGYGMYSLCLSVCQSASVCQFVCFCLFVHQYASVEHNCVLLFLTSNFVCVCVYPCFNTNICSLNKYSKKNQYTNLMKNFKSRNPLLLRFVTLFLLLIPFVSRLP